MAGSRSSENGHDKNAANDRNCLFPGVGCIIFCIHAVIWTFIFVSSIEKDEY